MLFFHLFFGRFYCEAMNRERAQKFRQSNNFHAGTIVGIRVAGFSIKQTFFSTNVVGVKAVTASWWKKANHRRNKLLSFEELDTKKRTISE